MDLGVRLNVGTVIHRTELNESGRVAIDRMAELRREMDKLAVAVISGLPKQAMDELTDDERPLVSPCGGSTLPPERY